MHQIAERAVDMEDKLYTINQVAEILDLHHKPIRNFISQGKLKAGKVGKQWRVSEADLNELLKSDEGGAKEEEDIAFSAPALPPKAGKKKVSVSTVVDLEQVGKEQYERISNTLIAIMNVRDPMMENSSINMKYNEKEKKFKILLWGKIGFMEEMLSVISILSDTEEKGEQKR